MGIGLTSIQPQKQGQFHLPDNDWLHEASARKENVGKENVGKENRSGIRDLFSFPTFSFLAKTVIYFSLPMKLAKNRRII
jgi:hypothetical protein